MRELEEIPFPSKYLLISSQFTMTLYNCVQISWYHSIAMCDKSKGFHNIAIHFDNARYHSCSHSHF